MKFTIRTYSKKELACLYFPNVTPGTARRNLRAWIDVYPELKDALDKAGYNSRGSLLTPAQIKIFYDFLGDPEIK